ncbi:MAG: ScyD/ScyE family protein [Caldilineae bacterium]|nr:MAG: ScyD/ScyE family protein [Caldilineae bacterium]
MHRTRSITIGLLIALILSISGGVVGAQGEVVAGADGEAIAQGFNGPQGILVDPNGDIWVIDSGMGGPDELPWITPEGEQVMGQFGPSAQVARIAAADHAVTQVASLPSLHAGQDTVGGARLALVDGLLYATSGQGMGAPDAEMPANMGAVVRIDPDGTVTTVASAWDFERANNPDPALYDSHPYGLEAGPDGMLYVADAGGNDLLKVDPATGEVSLVAVFEPLPGVFPRPDRGGEMLTDPVPTDVVFDGAGNALVSLLPGAPFVPGSSKVVQVAPDGTVSDYAAGYTMLTDLAWGPDGNLYGVQFAVFGEQGPTPNSGAVVRIVAGSGPEPVIEGLSFPIALDFNEAGDAYVAINAVGPPGSGAVVAFSGLAAPAGQEAGHGEVHWGYEGDTGPDHWGALNPDWALCSTGQEQSPVDIPAGAPVNPANIVYNYDPTALNIVNNGHTIQVNYDPGSAIQIEGVTYELKQFHFHALSEHTVAGQYADMEMHLVHQSAEGGYAVVGVFINAGAENPAFAPMWEHLPAMAGEPETIDGVTVNADDMLPAERTYWRYNGSFTTPPCTEGVKWVVLNQDVNLSADQLGAFTSIMHDNYRPVQPMNDRTFLSTAAAPPETLPVTGGVVAEEPSPNELPWALMAGLALIVLGVAFLLRQRLT